jgi:phosphohistidine swiveling domain-containing protein
MSPWDLCVQALPILHTYAGVLLVAPILVGMLVLSAIALFAALVVAFGFLSRTLAILAAVGTLVGAAAGLVRLSRWARSLLPEAAVIGLNGPLGRVRSAAEVGSKAAWLGDLKARGENVPAALIVSPRLFAQLVRGAGLADLPVSARAEAVRGRPWSGKARRTLNKALRRIGAERVIVRSSFPGEGGTAACSAGIYESVPDVDAGEPAAVEVAVRQVYASYWSEHARAYRAALGLPEPEVPRLALLLQRQMDHEVRGHAASLDPATGRDDRVRVEATSPSGGFAAWSLVGGGAAGGEVQGELRSFEGDDALRPAAERLKNELHGLVRRAERCHGAPVEIEWGLAQGELCLYQSRPLSRHEPHRVHSNGSWGEGIPRVLTPLSESVLIDGIGWLDGLAAQLQRLGLETRGAPAPAARHRGRWYLLEAPWRQLQDGSAGLGVQLRAAREAGRAAWSGRRLLARADRCLDEAERIASEDPSPVLAVLRPLVELDHAAGMAADSLRRTAAVLGARNTAFGGLEVGNRRALLTAALAQTPRLSNEELVRRFGDLADDDLELNTPRYREAPEQAFERGDVPAVVAQRREPVRSWFASPLAAFCLRAGLGFARLRESCRARIDRANAELRRRALSFGKSSWPNPPISDAVFFLRIPEWIGALTNGSLPDADELGRRAARWREDRAAAAPDRIVVRPDGSVAEDLEPIGSASVDEGVFMGTGAGPGVVVGRTLLLPSSEPVGGRVVVLPDSDARHLRSLIGAAGVILRTGGVLSHLAMVVRDLGLPCVFAPGFTAVDGTEVTVEGDSGRVLIGKRPVDGAGRGPVGGTQ